MDISKMKNIVVLKNIPSNIVEEAIVVLKPNQKVRQIQHIERNMSSEKNIKKNSKEYIVKEAEMVIANYISNMENIKSKNKSMKEIVKRYSRLKLITFLLAGIIFFNFIIYLLQ